MKIGAKLGVCFVLLAVVPLGAASLVSLRATQEFGMEMADRGKELLAQRLTHELRRVTENGAVAFEERRQRIERETKFLASEVASGLSGDAPEDGNGTPSPRFLLADAAAGNGAIDLSRLKVGLSEDASRDSVAETLRRLDALPDVARSVYLRGRDVVGDVSVALESGIYFSYPAGVKVAADPRESDWYVGTLERGEQAFYMQTSDAVPMVVAATPIVLDDGRLAGVARIGIRLADVLNKALDPTRLPPEASAYLLGVSADSPGYVPEVIAALGAETREWEVREEPRTLVPDGDDNWLKVIGDLQAGVPGLEYVRRAGVQEVWAFGPVGRMGDTAIHLAAVFPARIIETARDAAAEVVESAFMAQVRNVALFAVSAGGVAVLLALFGARSLTRPIRDLHEAARKLARGDFTVRIDATGGDELGQLGRGFNRMVPALEEQLRVKRDLHVAREIQQHLMPRTPPRIEGFDIAGLTVYCDETGGDYQDFIPLGADGRIGAVIGDVTGHGIGAAMLMATARAAFRAAAPYASEPGALLGAANRQLSQDSSGGRFLTLFFLQLTPGERQLRWISAGHEKTLLYDPATDSFATLDGDGIPLGVDAAWVYQDQAATFPEGGVLVAYTDGIREAENPDGENFGLERLKAAVREASDRGAQAICAHVLQEVDAFRGEAPAKDDVSILVVRPAD